MDISLHKYVYKYIQYVFIYKIYIKYVCIKYEIRKGQYSGDRGCGDGSGELENMVDWTWTKQILCEKAIKKPIIPC